MSLADTPGVIGAPVIDDNELIRHVRGVHDRHKIIKNTADSLFFIVGRHNNGNVESRDLSILLPSTAGACEKRVAPHICHPVALSNPYDLQSSGLNAPCRFQARTSVRLTWA